MIENFKYDLKFGVVIGNFRIWNKSFILGKI